MGLNKEKRNEMKQLIKDIRKMMKAYGKRNYKKIENLKLKWQPYYSIEISCNTAPISPIKRKGKNNEKKMLF